MLAFKVVTHLLQKFKYQVRYDQMIMRISAITYLSQIEQNKCLLKFLFTKLPSPKRHIIKFFIHQIQTTHLKTPKQLIYKIMNRKRVNEAHEGTVQNDYDSLFGLWQGDTLSEKSYGRFPEHYFDFNSGMGSLSIFSGDGVEGARGEGERKEGATGSGSYEIGQTISLSDMIKTNCSHRAINSIGRMAGFNKESLISRQEIVEPIPETELTELEPVSNRRLQNRASSRRARERRKQQRENMRDIIEDLERENIYLRQSLQKQGKNIPDTATNKGKGQGSRWKYCGRCSRQIWASRWQETQQVDQESSSSRSEEREHKSFLYRNQQILAQQKGSRIVTINPEHRKTHKKPKPITQMQAEFQDIDFGFALTKNSPKTHTHTNIKTHKNEPQRRDRERDRRWVGKIWIALSILMLVIGVQLNGLEGAGEKSIRINEKQAKRWFGNFQDPQVSSFTIKMKSKYPNTFIQSQKQQKQSHFPFSSLYTKKSQPYHHSSDPNPTHNSQKAKKLHQNSKEWLSFLSFESQQMYAREAIDQEEVEFQIDKDLLFSIHAELDDIGRYI